VKRSAEGTPFRILFSLPSEVIFCRVRRGSAFPTSFLLPALCIMLFSMRSDIIQSRKEKVTALRESGIDPYPQTSSRDHVIARVHDDFGELEQKEKSITISGRVRSVRTMGKIAFVHMEDESGRIQVFLEKNTLGEDFGVFSKMVDLGDFIEVSGTVFMTRKDERTVKALSWRMLSKTLRPTPTEHFGMKDEEELLRKRYLDLMTNPETRELFRKKNLFWQSVRTFLVERGFLEVQTPVLEHIPGGAEAESFMTHYNALDEDLYLRISLELALKRLLVGGFEKVFEIGRLFRNEGMDRDHLQEYDDVEFYWAYADLEQGIQLSESLFRELAHAVLGSYKHTYDGHEIDWEQPFPRIDYFEAFQKETGIDLSSDVRVKDLRAKADELNIPYEKTAGKGRLIDTVYKKTVRKKLIQPCVLVGHPVEVSPLSKRDPQNPKKVLRMQIVAGGAELCNAFSELNDPQDQRTRFEEQMKLREAGDAEAQMIDEGFLEALEYGMPPAFGFGMSERVFAFFLNKSVRETVIFPAVRGKE